MKNNRKILALVLCVAMLSVSALTGCSSGSQKSEAAAAPAEAPAEMPAEAPDMPADGVESYYGSTFMAKVVSVSGDTITVSAMRGFGGSKGKGAFENGEMPSFSEGEMPSFSEGEKPSFNGGDKKERPSGRGSTEIQLQISDASVLKDAAGNAVEITSLQEGKYLQVTMDENGNVTEILYGIEMDRPDNSQSESSAV